MTNFQTAQIFGDNMVLQFQKPISVFGTGTDGTKITVSISGMEAATNSTVVHNGRWLVMLPPQPAQDSVELTVSDGSESRTFTNVPVQRNYRTNIYGSLLTNTTDFTVVIEPAFATTHYNLGAL